MMPFVLLSLAALALAAGLVVLWLDQRQRAAHSADDVATDTVTDTDASADAIAADSADGAAPEAAQPEAAQPEATADASSEPKPGLIEEPVIAAESETAPEPEAEQAVEATPEPAPAHSFAERAERARHLVPGSARRERKAFGQQHGWEYIKHDSYLADEWTRGAAARGQEPRYIVAGSVRGHETLLFDMGSTPVMAMRTGAASDIVVDFRRAGEEAENHSEDLVYVREEEGFQVFATDAGVGQRLIDARVTDALSRLPAAVTAVWMEGEWALAQTTRQARSAEWEALLEPLATLADSARVLPPRSEATQVLRVDELDPSRDIPEPPQPEPTGPTAVPDRDDSLDTPTIQRPTEPVVMPSRTTSEARGTIDHSSLGADEVDAIADGHERPTHENNQARLPRRFDGGSSIFD